MKDFSILTYLFIFFAVYLGWLIILSLFSLLFSVKERRFKTENLRVVILAAATALFARLAIAEPLKRIFDTERPNEIFNNGLAEIISFPNSAAFPSGHASFFFGLATPIFLWNPKIGAIYYFLAFLNALGRVGIGFHWPKDILAGALIGITSGFFIWKISKKFKI